jgi:ubiquinone/menaquinone biosynthesis C-methylase UbiE
MSRLSSAQIELLDAYQLLAALGKKVVHPGGRQSTAELLRMADIRPEHHVLEVGCGPGTTAVMIAQRYGARVTAVDINEMMIDKAREAVAAAGLSDRVTVERQDIQQLTAPDNTYDRVIIEAVTMFVDLEQSAREVVRVCKPGGIVVDHEFIWTKEPTPRIRQAFQVEVCRMVFETRELWEGLYRRAGLDEVETVSGRFVMMTPRGFIRDEGFGNTLRIAGRVLSRWAFIKKVAWNVKRILPAAPYLGWVVVAGVKKEA